MERGRYQRQERSSVSENGFTIPARAKTLLQKAGLKARKRLGQHFLVDKRVLASIVRAAELSPEDTVIEVGPGLGILTLELVKRAKNVIAVELDTRLAELLRQHLRSFPNLKVVEADILKVNPADLLEGKTRYKVVANLPYYITSPVLHHFVMASPRPALMVMMLQKEVAEAIVAKAGKMGLLAIALHIYSKPKIVAYVPAKSFYPRPKVDSAIVRFDMLSEPAIKVDIDGFITIVRAGFDSPRKQLRNSLAHGLGIKPAEAADLLHKAGIDSQRRAETLSLEEWSRLYEVVSNAGVRLLC